jgi:hypothetical protein
MSTSEKIYSAMAICYLAGMILFLLLFPSAREIKYLLPLALLGIAVNAGLLFVVLRDILSRSFSSWWRKYFFVVIVFLFLPAVIIYLPLHGFKKK